ncbi:CPBP family glutamic-type intramembrane protease [Taylorella equigenitalis]|uniref:CPBP family glutamic-type intramembrane protease n=1 Tax=Taylorella equigenitalis TaxID=29575 RepID=UPI000406048B|nr:CPBP family glutamic-type intramembrane protease [Taylorella equigenitalis]ASY37411.1 CPBP family intramembrane metalloprotease [Taylorella equigenitalis]KGK33384.1 hypothetical protein LW90_04710 [Taylorella equigenitalis]RBA25901.1 CPBP family intramembrane metalloprotease [Taylorella equigenitalis]WDU48183.1 CPBP family intramembrane metalloprotease [Taylorella equigenitalis]
MFKSIKELLLYIAHPKYIEHGPAHSDFSLNVPLGRIFKWVLLMWLVDLVIFAPIVVAVSKNLGVDNQIDPTLPYLVPLAAVWAPIVEELIFRFSLRRPMFWILCIPLGIMVFGSGPIFLSFAVVGVLVLVIIYLDSTGKLEEKYALPPKYKAVYYAYFPFVFHASVIVFACLHVFNYDIEEVSVLMFLLVLPQLVTGYVIAWFRMKYSFISGVLFHAIFNGGPVILVWLAMKALKSLPPEEYEKIMKSMESVFNPILNLI